jgi:hypothetical protein
MNNVRYRCYSFCLVTIQDVNNRKPFVSVTRIDQQVVNRATMPESLRFLYEQAEPAPALHLLNPYRSVLLISLIVIVYNVCVRYV